MSRTSEASHTKTALRRSSFDAILTLVSERNRWLIYRELLKGKPLPVSELAKRTGAMPSNVSKHVNYMERCGFLIRGFGNLYEIPPQFIVPGQNALDFGAVLIRFDYMP
jgi:predicted transcriptional regulator